MKTGMLSRNARLALGAGAMLFAGALLCAGLLSGCGARKGTQSGKPVTIRWWHINQDVPSQTAFEAIAADFKKAHPGVDIKIVMLDNMEYKAKLRLQLAANDPPEMFHSWGGGGLAEQAKAGYLRDITDWYNSDRWHSKINPAAMEIFSYNGRMYGFPHDLGAVGFWYNGETLAKAGYSSFPTDWDSFVAMLRALKAKGLVPLSVGISDRWPVMYYWVYLSMRVGGYDIFNEINARRKTFNDPAIVEAGKMMRKLYEAGFFQETAIGNDFIDESRLIGDGKCVMHLMGQWALSIQAQASEQKDKLVPAMRFAPFPAVKGGKGSVGDAMGGGNGFVIGRDAPDQAVEFLEFFTRKENLQRYFDAFPAIPTVEGITVKFAGLDMVQGYLRTMSHYCLYPDQLFPEAIGNLLNETSARVLIGEISPEEGCALLDKAWSAAK